MSGCIGSNTFVGKSGSISKGYKLSKSCPSNAEASPEATLANSLLKVRVLLNEVGVLLLLKETLVLLKLRDFRNVVLQEQLAALVNHELLVLTA